MLLSIADLSKPADVLAPYMDMAQGLTQIYLSHIASSQTDSYKYEVSVSGSSSKSRKPGIHASEISKCERQMVYSLLNVERKPDTVAPDVNMLMRFRLGHAVHAMVQNDWHEIAKSSKGRISFTSEAAIHPGLGGVAKLWTLMSSADGIITLHDENLKPVVRVGLEIKTESDGQYEKLRVPRPDHKEQTTLYMAALDLPILWVFYYNKSSSNFTGSTAPWLYTFNKALWEELEMRFARGTHYAEVGELPAKSEGMHCRWCPFAHTCKPSGATSWRGKI